MILSEISKLVKGKRTAKQALNLIKYKLSSPAETLNYAPTVLCVSPTDRCNFKCDMCLTHSSRSELNEFKHKPASDISYEMFCQVVDKFEQAISLQLIGTGEPILHKDFFRMVEYAAVTKKMDVCSISNGFILDRVIDQVIDSQLASLCISLNGHKAEEFERLTGEPGQKYQRICQNILKLTEKKQQLNKGPLISVSYILDQHNYRFMEEMLIKAEELKVDEVIFNNYLSAIELEGYSSNDRTLFSDMEEVKKVINSLAAKTFKVKYFLPTLLDRRPVRKCSVYFTHIRVDGNGDVGACGRMLLNLSGNGKFNEPDIWNNEYFRKMRAVYLNSKLPLPKPCESCFSNSES